VFDLLRLIRALKPLFLAEERTTAVSPKVRFLNCALALALLSRLLAICFIHLDFSWNWAAIYRYREKFIQGWMATVMISAVALLLSTAIGLLFAVAGRSRLLILRYCAKIYVELIRGTPPLVQILIFFYVIADAAGITNRYLVGTLSLSILSGAYISEIFRAGIESVGRTQLDSARAVGFTAPQTYRYVIFPQALRHVLPPLAGEFASLIKNSSLLSIIALSELTQNAREVSAMTYSNFESYLLLAVGYLVLTLPISLWTKRLEAHSHYET
jgi:polar amino acid transport system permease protein